MKSELYSPMKPDLSKKGLSEIMEESYKDELENSKYELAKLSNQQFLSQYLQLNNNRSIINEYKYLLETPTCEFYKKFDFNEIQKKENFRNQIKRSIQNGIKRTINYFTKEELKAMANKKLVQSAQKQKLSTSRKEKRENFYETLRSSRKKEENKEIKSERSGNRQQPQASKFQSPKKHAIVEQSIDDLFLRLDVIGENRDKIKKKWYGWGEKGKIQEKHLIMQQWISNHQLMKNLLEVLLQKLNKSIGTVQVFNQLKISNQNSILQGFNSKSLIRTEYEKSLGSTRIERNLKNEDVKVIYRFGSWFNKLLLDQREIEYIQNLKR